MSGVIDLQNGRYLSDPLRATSFAKVQLHCADETLVYGGCAFLNGHDNYEIWYADSQCIAFHEACHAMAQSRHHTGAFNVRAAGVDWHTAWLAACPDG